MTDSEYYKTKIRENDIKISYLLLSIVMFILGILVGLML